MILYPPSPTVVQRTLWITAYAGAAFSMQSKRELCNADTLVSLCTHSSTHSQSQRIKHSFQGPSLKKGPVCPKRGQSGRCGDGVLSRSLLSRWHQVCWRRWLFSNCHSDPQMSVVSTSHFVSVWPLSCQTIRLPSPVGTGRHWFKERKWLIRGHTASE